MFNLICYICMYIYIYIYIAAGRLFLYAKYVWAVPSQAGQGTLGHRRAWDGAVVRAVTGRVNRGNLPWLSAVAFCRII